MDKLLSRVFTTVITEWCKTAGVTWLPEKRRNKSFKCPFYLLVLLFLLVHELLLFWLKFSDLWRLTLCILTGLMCSLFSHELRSTFISFWIEGLLAPLLTIVCQIRILHVKLIDIILAPQIFGLVKPWLHYLKKKIEYHQNCKWLTSFCVFPSFYHSSPIILEISGRVCSIKWKWVLSI